MWLPVKENGITLKGCNSQCAENQQTYISLPLKGQDAVLQPVGPHGRAISGAGNCELQHTSLFRHGEEQGHLRWMWQDGAGLSMEAVSGASSHIPAGSPPPYDGTTLKSPCQYGPVTRHVKETCRNTCAWLTCVSEAMKMVPIKLTVHVSEKSIEVS